MNRQIGWRRRKKKRASSSKVGLLIILALLCLIIIMFYEKSSVSIKTLKVTSGSIKKVEKVRVIDGDTIELGTKIIRLYGIDAPEKNQPCVKNKQEYNCGNASKEHLKFIISGLNVSCEKKGNGGWGRELGLCRADSEDIGRLMVKHGWAVAYRKYSILYVTDENFARINKLGMWSKQFTPPEAWRKLKKEHKL